MARINLNNRPTPGGSFEERLAPRIGRTGLNERIGSSRLPRPLVRKTSGDETIYPSADYPYRDLAGLPRRFRKG
jgi:hypothetical protein